MGVDGFPKPTIDALAKRANHTCSNPACRARTSGPSTTDSGKAVNVGVAAHITADAAGGPRYDATLTSDQRRGADNGIWLCQTCSRLIDVNDGADYPVDTLKQWKADHEAEIARSIGKAEQYELAGKVKASGVGIVTGAQIQRPTRIAPGTHVSASGVGQVTGVKIGGK